MYSDDGQDWQCQCSGLTPGPAWPAPALNIMTAELLPTLHRNVREDGERNAALVWVWGMRDASRWGSAEGGNERPSSVYWRGGGMWTMSVSSAWYKLIILARKGHTITRSEHRIHRVIKCHQQVITTSLLAQMRCTSTVEVLLTSSQLEERSPDVSESSLPLSM